MSIYKKPQEHSEHFDKIEIVRLLKLYYKLDDKATDESLITHIKPDLVNMIKMVQLVNFTKYPERQLVGHLLELYGNDLFDKQTITKLKNIIKKKGTK